MTRAATRAPCTHRRAGLRRIGIQWSELGNGKLYLLMCPSCGSCVSTFSLRRQRARQSRSA